MSHPSVTSNFRKEPVLPELVERLWEGGGYGARRDRLPFRYRAFVPDAVAEWDRPLAGRAAEAVAQASAALAQLQTPGRDLEAVATTFLRAEALGSSFIEGLRASNKRLALAAYEPRVADPTARAVLGNVRAMERAIAIGAEPRPFGVLDMLDIHRALLGGTTEERYAGVIRTGQNWIGGRGVSPRDAAFIPPPDEYVPELLDDLVRFMNLDDIPAVSQAAIAHAQFETIHPFGDGNGRTGRCLVHVVFRRRNVIERVAPPVSVVLAANAKRYISGLVDFREGRADDWVGAFADAVTISARSAMALGARIDVLLDELTERAGSPRRDSVARRIIRGLPRQPVVSAESAANSYGVTTTAARAALNRLESDRVLQPTRVGRRRDREWTSDELFQVLDAFEYNLGEPQPGEHRRPAPPPTRPPAARAT
jgi:Fic family protein